MGRKYGMKRIDISEHESVDILDIILNEELLPKRIAVPREIIKTVGMCNSELRAKRIYELVLRITERFPIMFCGVEEDNLDEEDYIWFSEKSEVNIKEELRTDCYIIARYREILQQAQMFDEAVLSVMNSAIQYSLLEFAVSCLESMLSYNKEYYAIYNATQPILIYKGDNICHNILNQFAEEFGDALEKNGEVVEFFDPENEGIEHIVKYVNNHFKAIIGIQSYFFSIKMDDGYTYLHDLIDAPKYNLIVDHPVLVKKYLSIQIKNISYLLFDENYVEFVKRYYNKNAYLFPLAGTEQKGIVCAKEYELTFVGEFHDYRKDLQIIRNLERKVRFLTNKVMIVLRKNTKLTTEEALRKVLYEERIQYTENQFVEILYSIRYAYRCVMHYYRYRVVETILENGYVLDVFGDNWKECDLVRYPNLRIHPSVNVNKSFEIWQKSKMSLNIMSWHKSGFTERMANIMLAKAVLITDATAYLDSWYKHGEDLIIFDLEHLELLPHYIDRCLCENEAARIAKNGFEKTREKHTWKIRAKEFINDVLKERD